MPSILALAMPDKAHVHAIQSHIVSYYARGKCQHLLVTSFQLPVQI